MKGPRYCPSLEFKLDRFPDKLSHQVWLEREGLKSNLIYPNGITTGLPLDIQRQIVHLIPGLEKAELIQPGYIVEYDYINPATTL